MPRRIQRKRVKGWRMPGGVIYVGRPTRYGNPYWHVEKFHGRGLSLALYENTAQGIWNPALLDGMPDPYVRQVYDTHREWTARFSIHPLEEIEALLGGKDLACWCREDAPCHADILIRLANPANQPDLTPPNPGGRP